MTEHCAVAIYRTMEEAQTALGVLDEARIPRENVSMVVHSVSRELPDKEAIQPGDDAERSAAKGAGLGGLVGILAGAPLLLIPGIGPVLFAGPLAAGITGAIVGGFLGSMRGWGVHHDHVRDYEEKVKEGHPLIVVNGSPEIVAEARTLMLKTDAMEVHLHETDSNDARHIDDRPGHVSARLP